MILSTTSDIAGREISEHCGLVFGETIMGANFVRDIFASVTDFIGGRSGVYETKMQEARDGAIAEMTKQAEALGANAIIGIKLDYGVVGDSMMMVSAAGTAVSLK